jgi:Flp pilus assembly protein TadG
MLTRSPSSFFGNDLGASTIEFVVVIFAVVATVFFVLETTLYMFFSEALHKSAQAGVRAAVVSDPVVAGVPARNERSAAGLFGVSCSDATSPCTPFADVSCTGGACIAAEFDRIFAHMNGFSGQLQPDHVTISYQWAELGYAGGPITPLITVSVSGVPFQTGIVGLLLSNAGVLATLPAHSVSMTGEDLNRGGTT